MTDSGAGATRLRWTNRRRDRVVRAAWVLTDAVIVLVSTFVAALTRYDFSVSSRHLVEAVTFAVVAALLYVVASAACGAMQVGHVRGSFEETSDIVRAMSVTAIALVVLRFATPWFDVPRSLPFTTPLFAVIFMFAVRFAVRSWRWGRRSVGENDKRLIVFGAGTMGRGLIRSLNSAPGGEPRLVPVALLDDDLRKRRLSIEGLRVSGGREAIAAEAARTTAEAIVIASATMDGESVREISDLARGAGLDVLILPPVTETLRAPRSTDLRQLNLEDLLGRSRIELDQDAIRSTISGKRVLVTGAGGSIGSELCRQLMQYEPDRLVLLDRDESGLHAAQMSISGRALLDDGTLALCDIRDPSAVHAVFERERPQVVFHAAALKHLTLLEQFPAEAWKTNVLGTLNVLDAARAVGVTTFVNVSTDKAAWPSSVLGYSKRLAERLTASFATTGDPTYVSVRFGNVLGSRGSVITAFTAQIEAGGPVTVTHPDVERFFMLIPEACQLVLEAAAIGTDGDVMVLEMGKPVKIIDVARSLIKMSGRQDVEIEFTGLRPGEKLSEQLFTPGEDIHTSQHPLVSHVTVPALDPEAVRGRRFFSPEAAHEWMAAHSGGHLHHDPEQDIAITAGAHALQPDRAGQPRPRRV